MKFTYLAPIEYSDLSSGFRTVESEYHGPHDFKVHVDKITRKVEKGVEYDHDGCTHTHGGSDNSPPGCDMVYLHSHNPNHIVLMALITNHEHHTAVNKVEVVCEKYNMVYQRHEPMAVDHTYSFKDCTIDERGVVTYPWYKLEWSWDMLVAQGRSHKNTIRERQRVDILTQAQHDKADYCCEIIDYVILNQISKNHPHKIAWPDIHSVTLDNSMPIGLPDGIPNADRTYDLSECTSCWGIVPHEHCCHAEGHDFVLESICPTTAAEAAALAPWEMSAEVYSHAVKVAHYHSCDDELCNDVGGHVEITFEEIAHLHTTRWEVEKTTLAPSLTAPPA